MKEYKVTLYFNRFKLWLRKNNVFQKSLILGLLGFATWFTCKILFNFEKTGQEPIALIGAVFALITAELGYLMTLANTDKKQQKRSEENEP